MLYTQFKIHRNIRIKISFSKINNLLSISRTQIQFLTISRKFPKYFIAIVLCNYFLFAA